ncbi:metallophosphoesterase [Shimia thalassica]|uniref:metallophosphoesterase family protein n=1 Tax=Shimia thalassica TaxID=1715693 RepID=UPI0026E263D6|nr:metallophosphoesterase [Shimia thalassica]MDO6521673.1 metallophosphoesterase [Shimia thalassica]
MRILAFSDLHLDAAAAASLVAQSKDVDLVLAAGDFCNARHGLREALGLLDQMTCRVVAVPGNCESEAELASLVPPNWTVLHGASTQIDGLSICGLGYGVPETPFGSWSCDLSEDAADQMLSPVAHADIVVTHSPPKGIADRTSTGLSVGSRAIRDALARLQPKLAVCGHVHDCWGEEGMIGNTPVYNLGPSGRIFEVVL